MKIATPYRPPFHTLKKKELLEFCVEHGLEVKGYSSLPKEQLLAEVVSAWRGALHRAYRQGCDAWFDYRPVPDLPPPPLSGSLVDRTHGWRVNEHTLEVLPAWSSSTLHGRDRDYVHASQGPIRLYSTPELALNALRDHVVRDTAEKLHEIDRFIQQLNKRGET